MSIYLSKYGKGSHTFSLFYAFRAPMSFENDAQLAMASGLVQPILTGDASASYEQQEISN